MTIHRGEKDALMNVPGAGLTLYEQMGIGKKQDRWGSGLEHIGSGPASESIQTKQFDRLEQYAKLNAAPAVKFKDLEEVVRHKISYNLMPFDVQTDFVQITNDTVMVPDSCDEKLANSSLILADDVEPVPSKSVGTGMFVIGTTKVRPRVAPADGKPAVFKRGQKVNFWMQVYNLSVDEKTHKPSATFEYDIVNAATNKAVVHAVESSEKMGNIGDQVTLQKAVAAANLDPGVYRIQIKVSDNISKQTVAPTSTFAVE